MATAKKKKAPKAGRSKASAPQDAIGVLKADHRQVEEWFEAFEATNASARK
jgi:hemerythrin superfamily protein